MGEYGGSNGTHLLPDERTYWQLACTTALKLFNLRTTGLARRSPVSFMNIQALHMESTGIMADNIAMGKRWWQVARFMTISYIRGSVELVRNQV